MSLNLTQVGDIAVQQHHLARCHCGSVVFELYLPQGLIDIRRCDCSMCRRRGAIVASVNLDDITIIQGQQQLSLYQFNTYTAKHYFCHQCGIYTHHQRRSNPHQYAFNIGCLDSINPLIIPNVPNYDGINHPTDSD